MFWAQDGFRGRDGVWGGDLVDTDTPVAMRDKVQHLAGGALVQLIAERWLPDWHWLALVGMAAVSIEIVEVARYLLRGPSAFLADKPSWRDVLVTVAGGVLAWLAL